MNEKDKKSARLNKITVQIAVLVINMYYVFTYTIEYAEKEEGIVYVLVWTPFIDMPFLVMHYGLQGFIRRNCTFQNCFLTDQRSFFFDLLDFDVILFNVMGISDNIEMPRVRSGNQNYILVGMEPAGVYKVPPKLNKEFNFTWTYKLDSDVVFPYISVKNEHDEKIGPKVDMHWINIQDMNQTSKYVKEKLQRKRIAAAIFVSNCVSSNERMAFAKELREVLANYSQRVDIYGACGERLCERNTDECYALIESNYYFYLAFENSFGEDYVTEKLLNALEHFAVPVVYGTANYTRFMPDGIYLNALTLGPAKLAHAMLDAIYNKEKYLEFFKWHGYYSFHYTGEDDFHDEICGLCDLLNNKTLMKQNTVRPTNVWWNEWHNGPPRDDDNFMKLIVDEEKTNSSGISGVVANIYNYIFDN